MITIDNTQVTLNEEAERALTSTSNQSSNPVKWHSTHCKSPTNVDCGLASYLPDAGVAQHVGQIGRCRWSRTAVPYGHGSQARAAGTARAVQLFLVTSCMR